MAHYFLRPELHNHEAGDYEQLHKELASIGYYRVIKGSDNIWYDLPTGEYYKDAINLLAAEKALVDDAILKVVNNNKSKTKDYYYVLTNSAIGNFGLRLKKTRILQSFLNRLLF